MSNTPKYEALDCPCVGQNTPQCGSSDCWHFGGETRCRLCGQPAIGLPRSAETLEALAMMGETPANIVRSAAEKLRLAAYRIDEVARYLIAEKGAPEVDQGDLTMGLRHAANELDLLAIGSQPWNFEPEPVSAETDDEHPLHRLSHYLRQTKSAFDDGCITVTLRPSEIVFLREVDLAALPAVAPEPSPKTELMTALDRMYSAASSLIEDESAPVALADGTTTSLLDDFAKLRTAVSGLSPAAPRGEGEQGVAWSCAEHGTTPARVTKSRCCDAADLTPDDYASIANPVKGVPREPDAWEAVDGSGHAFLMSRFRGDCENAIANHSQNSRPAYRGPFTIRPLFSRREASE